MPLYALEDLDDAWEATRAFLWPADRSRWLKLALVALFAGGPGANFNALQFNVPADRGMPPGGVTVPSIGPRGWLLIAALAGSAVVLGLVVLLVGSIMEFVLVESLRREAVSIRRYWSRRWRQGVRLFAFRLVLGLLVVGSAVVVAGLVLAPAFVGPGPGAVPGGIRLALLVLLLPVLFVLAVVVGLVNGFTTVFVVPVMVLEDRGVLASWRRLWPSIVAHPWQYLTYAIAGFVLTIAGGVAVGVVAGVAALVLLIPFGILGAIGFVLLSAVPPLGVGVLAVVGLLFLAAVIVVVALAQVPVVTYLRYYALLVLGDIEPDLDLIPDRRAAIREPTEGASA